MAQKAALSVLLPRASSLQSLKQKLTISIHLTPPCVCLRSQLASATPVATTFDVLTLHINVLEIIVHTFSLSVREDEAGTSMWSYMV